jgi:hypothetical protein
MLRSDDEAARRDFFQTPEFRLYVADKSQQPEIGLAPMFGQSHEISVRQQQRRNRRHQIEEEDEIKQGVENNGPDDDRHGKTL